MTYGTGDPPLEDLGPAQKNKGPKRVSDEERAVLGDEAALEAAAKWSQSTEGELHPRDDMMEKMVESPDWTIEKLRGEIRGLASQLEIAHKQEQANIEMLRDTRNALRHAMSLIAYFAGTK